MLSASLQCCLLVAFLAEESLWPCSTFVAACQARAKNHYWFNVAVLCLPRGRQGVLPPLRYYSLVRLICLRTYEDTTDDSSDVLNIGRPRCGDHLKTTCTCNIPFLGPGPEGC